MLIQLLVTLFAVSISTNLSAALLGSSVREVRIENGKKLIAFTFDLCESPSVIAGFDDGLVNFLEQNCIRATFFAGGKWMRSHPEETIRLMAQPLFEIGNHSWSHANFRNLDSREARQQVLLTQDQYSKIRSIFVARLAEEGAGQAEIARIPERPMLFRFPYGACTRESLSLLAELDLPAIQWNIVSGDPAPGRTSKAIISAVLAKVKPGSIMIFHANGKGRSTLEALHSLVPTLQTQGYEFVTVSELLEAGVPIGVPECYEERPGDTARYNRPVRR